MGSDQNAYLKIGENQKIPCLFNPTELSMTMANKWSSTGDGDKKNETVAGKGVQTLVFGGSENGTMDLTLFFDTTDSGKPVTDYTDAIAALMEIDSSIANTNESQRMGRPPTLQFGWGDMLSFPAVIQRLTLRFTYFSQTGTPLRATMTLALMQYTEAESYSKQNPTSGTPLPHKVHRVQPGETLDRISAQQYGDSNRWRLVAVANGIEDPLDLRPGRLLSIPKVDG